MSNLVQVQAETLAWLLVMGSVVHDHFIAGARRQGWEESRLEQCWISSHPTFHQAIADAERALKEAEHAGG